MTTTSRRLRAVDARTRDAARRHRRRRAVDARRAPTAASSRTSTARSAACGSAWASCTSSSSSGSSSRASGPLLWLAKSAVTPTQDTLSYAARALPERHRLGEPHARRGSTCTSTSTSSTRSCSRRARGSFQLLVATTGGYVLSVLRPSTRRSSTARCSRRCSSRRSCCSFRCTSRSCTRRCIGDVAAQQLPRGLAAGGGERVQHPAREALLRQPAARGVRGGADRRRRTVPPVLVDRAADVEADPRRRLGVRDHRRRWKDFLWPMLVLPDPPCSRSRCACPRSQRRPSSTCSSRRSRSRRSSRSCCSWCSSGVFLRSAGLGGAVKG